MDALRTTLHRADPAWLIRDVERRLDHARSFHARGKLSDEGYAILSRQLAAEMARIVRYGVRTGFPL